MAAQRLTPQQLQQVISETLSPYADTRRAAEARLGSAQQSAGGHLSDVLRLVANDATDPTIRQAAAVHFKNTVKMGWTENDHEIHIGADERHAIQTHLVQLMCTVPPQIQNQLSESISLIAAADYPERWQDLLPELVQQFSSTDPAVVNGVLRTANAIFKRFRYVQRSDDLYRVILYTLQGVQVPLLTLFQSLGNAVENFANDRTQLVPRMESLRLVCRIFYSLNYQDLPEFFEDHMGEWMTPFATYLQYQNPILVDEDEQVESSPIDKLQAAIVENLAHYAVKDEEPFMPYLPQFTSLIWNLLMNITAYPKQDILATRAIKFLCTLLEKQMHMHLFQNEGTLRQIVGRIVIPNIMFREVDEERFEDDPYEFILTEVEGSDSETRRRWSQELLRAMSRHFRTETIAIGSEHVGSMLREFNSDPARNWQAKDAAIHLMMGIAIRTGGLRGVTEINEGVNILELFETQILSELQDTNHASRPVVKATAIEFVWTFRNQFSRENFVQILPLLIHHLGSPVVVVHTFAAFAIERALAMVEAVGGTVQPRISSADLKPFLEPLFTKLFALVDNADQNENEYVMKCVMRSLVSAGDDVIPVTQIVITKLTSTLGRVAKNPRNPQFNHYLFESIAVLVQSVCSKDPNATTSFEQLLFDPFTTILSMDIAEFSPYVFQVLAQLLAYRPSGLGAAYASLFQPILAPVLWERKGNVPALTLLLQAYIAKAPNELVQYLNGILGVFQKLLASKQTEPSSFAILSSVVVHFPQEALEPKIGTIFQLLMMRLQESFRAPRCKRLVTNFFALFVGKFGAQVFLDRANALQSGVAVMLLQQVWLPRLRYDPAANLLEAKTQVIGMTKLLCESPYLLEDEARQEIWCGLLASVITILTSPTFIKASDKAPAGEDEVVEIGYDSQFSKLQFASRPAEDYFADVQDPTAMFVQSLHRLSASQPGRLLPFIQHGLSEDPKLSAALEAMFRSAGFQLS